MVCFYNIISKVMIKLGTSKSDTFHYRVTSLLMHNLITCNSTLFGGMKFLELFDYSLSFLFHSGSDMHTNDVSKLCVQCVGSWNAFVQGHRVHARSGARIYFASNK